MSQQTKAPAILSGGSGRGRIRTCEGISHQIYSLTPLATWVHARVSLSPTGSGREYTPALPLFKTTPGMIRLTDGERSASPERRADTKAM